jgi:hypothetical protein
MTLRGSSCVAALATVILTVAPHAQTPTPNVKKIGNAIREYQDSNIHAVIAYEYSHRVHVGKWLLVETAIQTKENLKFERTDFSLTTPTGTRIPLASEERYLADAESITSLQQNARVWGRNVAYYFVDKQSAGFRFFALPGEGTVTADIVTNTYGPAVLTLYFESQNQEWKGGNYSLTIDNGKARAVIPIELK